MRPLNTGRLKTGERSSSPRLTVTSAPEQRASTDWRIAVACALAALISAGAALLATISVVDGRISVLVRLGSDHPLVPLARQADPSFVLVDPDAHYDGVYHYTIARDPLALGVEHTLIDRVVYRYGHPAYGWLAYLLSLGQPALAPAALLLINLTAIAGAAAGASVIASRLGWSPWGGLAVALNPGLLYAVTADSSEALAALVLALVLLAWARRSWGLAGGLLVLLCLTREQLLLVPLALGLSEAVRWRQQRGAPGWRASIALLAGPLALGLWSGWLRARFGVWPLTDSDLALSAPLLGWVETLRGAALMGMGTYDEMQLGQAAVPLLIAVAGALALGAVRASRLRTPLDTVYLLFVALLCCASWQELLHPKDLFRASALVFLLLPAVLAAPGPAAARQ